MVKTERNSRKTEDIRPVSLASPCMDCLFWYRCRGSKLECLFRAPLNMAETVRA